VERIRSRIERGDTYQCNLTVRMRGRAPTRPLELYRQLALGQRGSYNAYLDLGRFVIASASPELFFERVGDGLVLRPMKGTAPRGRTLAEDRVQAQLLRTSAKERAENVMIVDLIRNDAARVAQVGTVDVPELCALERYETVLQLTSTVSAQLRPGVGLPELFGALFPSGSVTGVPKVSTMALIRELEATPRGVYCGAIGFVAPPGAGVRARFSVAIRTAVIDRDTGSTEYGVGGGITWSSDPEAEHREVVVKTAVLHRRHREFELIETLRSDPGRGLRNLDRHLARMASSAEFFGFRFDDESVRERLDRPWPEAEHARVRLRLGRNGQFVTEVSALEPAGDLVRLAVDHVAVDSTSRWLLHKTSQREPYDERRLRHPEADDVILVNERSELTETSRANLALRMHGRWWTPPLHSGCLPGVERGRLLESGVLTERVLTLADLHRAEGLAVVSSLRGWRSAVLAEGAVSALGVAPRAPA
jgi:para-aminobenzoate synthetase/4-amino-4-deoxychorismate lyase